MLPAYLLKSFHRRMTRARRALVSLAIPPLFLVINAGTALANHCPLPPCRFYTVAQNYDGQYYKGIFGSWRNNTTLRDDNDWSGRKHINAVMWAYTHTDNGQTVEMGIRNGYEDAIGRVAYYAYWGDHDRYNNYFRHPIAYTTPNGTNHTYQISRNGTNPNFWDVYYDYNFINTSTNQNSSTIWKHQG